MQRAERKVEKHQTSEKKPKTALKNDQSALGRKTHPQARMEETRSPGRREQEGNSALSLVQCARSTALKSSGV